MTEDELQTLTIRLTTVQNNLHNAEKYIAALLERLRVVAVITSEAP